MQSNDILENPARRPYHVLVGSVVCSAIYLVVLVGVRIVMH